MAQSPSAAKSPEMIERELEVLEYQLNGLPASRPQARTVFSFATPLDLAIIGISAFAAIVAGGLNPLLTASASLIFCPLLMVDGGKAWSITYILIKNSI